MGVEETLVEPRQSMLETCDGRFREALADTDVAEALRLVREYHEAGLAAEVLLFEVVLPAVDDSVCGVVEGMGGSLAQHFMTSQIAAQVADWLLPRFRGDEGVPGRMVLGTAAGDFHGLGKTIVSGCLRAHRFQVFDLGLNVSAARFVDEAVAREASVIGISSMMVHTALGEGGCRGVRRLLRERGLEGRIRIIVGGAPYRHDPGLFRAVEADACAGNGAEAVAAVRALMKEVAP